MKRKGIKIPAEKKLEIAIQCTSYEISASEAARKLGVDISTVRWWICLYREQGAEVFTDENKNKAYSEETRRNAVQSYLNGEGSYRTVAARYGLRSDLQLRGWVKMYTNGKDFKYKLSGGHCMRTSKKTTFEEKLIIVKDCLLNDSNYGATALKYNVSYNQVLYWVKRYKELGEAGLEDRRGRRKADQEPRSEMERLRIENEQLKHKLYMAEMERDLLKKVGELEREELLRK